MELANKLFLVTGGASGLGQATVQALLVQGAIVAVFDQNKISDSHPNLLSYSVDITNEEQVEQAIDAITKTNGLISGLVNCAGIAPAEKLYSSKGTMPMQHIQQVLQINLVGTLNLMRFFTQQFCEMTTTATEKSGVIVNTASIAAYEGQKGQTVYAASKAGIIGLTLPAARELAVHHIRVNTIAPGIFNTGIMKKMSDKVTQPLIQKTEYPKRLGQPTEFAKLVCHLIDNEYINGEVIRLDAGLRI